MNAMRQKARELLAQGEVKAVLGCTKGTFGQPRPLVVQKASELEQLTFDESCTFNLAGLLPKHEIRHLFPLAILGGPTLLRSLLQLMGERQLKDGQVLALVMAEGQAKVLKTGQELELHLALQTHDLPESDRAAMDRLLAMTPEARWAWWQEELSRCIKCYACRQTCPMCYCEHCTMDCNRPQWVPVASHDLGNLEYHMVRAMHLAGRCVQCGTCGTACPVEIPVHLLTMYAEERTAAHFGQRAGQRAKLDYALSTFRPDDKETFIR